MKTVKLDQKTVLRLQYAIIAAQLFPHYLISNNRKDIAAEQAHYAAQLLVDTINNDINDDDEITEDFE